jgi:starch-binding outer membrane protein, SusD/RagB family
MKYIWKTIVTILVLIPVLFVSSCTDLETEVYTGIKAEDFKPGAGDLGLLMAPVYTPIRALTVGWNGHADMMMESADILVVPVRPRGWFFDAGIFHRLHTHNWALTDGHHNNVWNNSWRVINTANRLKHQIDVGEIQLATEELKTKILNELVAIRAWAYYTLLDSHGNIPISTNFADPEPPNQFSRKDAFDFIVNDLLGVLPNLETEITAKTYGRFNKWAAHATLAKLYLNAEVYTGTPMWDQVIQQCNAIIASGKYVMENDYRTPFSTNNHNSKEVIFAAVFDEIQTPNGFQYHFKSWHPDHRLQRDLVGSPFGGVSGTPQFIDTYDPDDARLGYTWIWGPQYHFQTGQLLFTYVKHIPSLGASFGPDATNEDGYKMGKYEVKMGARRGLNNDWVIFRYTDVLMMKAEAMLRKGDAAGAAEIVTQVRERAFRDKPEKAAVTGAQLQQGSVYNYGIQAVDGTIINPQGGADIPFGRFLDELGWEFALEGRRRQDLIRFGVFHTKSWFNHSPSSIQKIIFPIPQSAIQTNPKLKQNPGY